MNRHYLSFIKLGQSLAEDRGIPWKMSVDAKGAVSPEERWNFNKLVEDDHPPYYYLRDFGCDAKSLQTLNAQRTCAAMAKPRGERRNSEGLAPTRSSVDVLRDLLGR